MKVKVLFFAGLRERVGKDQIDVTVPDNTMVTALPDYFPDSCRGAAALTKFCRWAVNEDFVGAERQLVDGDTVALIPPVAGG